MVEGFSLVNRTKAKLPRLAFAHMKRALLGQHYELSLVIVGERKARTLNRMYRGKNYVPNVLSFPLSKSAGEIFINPQKAEREAPRFGMSRSTYLAYLFIHACLHLKGMRHGATMESIERRALRRFKLTSTS